MKIGVRCFLCDQEDVDRYCTLFRIANLKADYVYPATGIGEDFQKDYQREIRESGILIPGEVLIDKDFVDLLMPTQIDLIDLSEAYIQILI